VADPLRALLTDELLRAAFQAYSNELLKTHADVDAARQALPDAMRDVLRPAFEQARRQSQRDTFLALIDEFEAHFGTDGDVGLIEVRRWLETRHVHWPKEDTE
jgi:hypothetical protein